MTHATPDDDGDEAIHIVIKDDGAMDIYVHPDKARHFQWENSPLDPHRLATRIEQSLIDIVAREVRNN